MSTLKPFTIRHTKGREQRREHACACQSAYWTWTVTMATVLTKYSQVHAIIVYRIRDSKLSPLVHKKAAILAGRDFNSTDIMSTWRLARVQ